MRKVFKRTLSVLLTAVILGAAATAAPITAKADENTPEIMGNTVTLDGTIRLNFFINENGFELDDELFITVVKDNNNLTEMPDNEDDIDYQKKYFTISNDDTYDKKVSIPINAREMADEFTIVTAWFDENYDFVSSSKTFSVKEYADTIINADDDYLSNTLDVKGATKQTQLKDLCKSMLNYGAKAQQLTSYNTDNLANDGISYSAPSINKSSLTTEDYSDDDGTWFFVDDDIDDGLLAPKYEKTVKFRDANNWGKVYIECEYTDPNDVAQTISKSEMAYDSTYTDPLTHTPTITYAYNIPEYNTITSITFTDGNDDPEKTVKVDTPQSQQEYLNDYEHTAYNYFLFTSTYEPPTGTYYTYDSIHTKKNIIEFVNTPNWDKVKLHYTDSQNNDAQITKELTKSSYQDETYKKDIYYIELTNDELNDNITKHYYFSNSNETSKTCQIDNIYSNYHYCPTRQTDKFADFGMKYIGTSIGMHDSVGYSILFATKNGYSTNVTDSKGNTITPVEYDFELWRTIYSAENIYNGSYYYYRYTGIPANELLNPIKLTFKNGTKTSTFNFSLNNYFKLALSLPTKDEDGSVIEENKSLKELVTALYDYGIKAKAYFG